MGRPRCAAAFEMLACSWRRWGGGAQGGRSDAASSDFLQTSPRPNVPRLKSAARQWTVSSDRAFLFGDASPVKHSLRSPCREPQWIPERRASQVFPFSRHPGAPHPLHPPPFETSTMSGNAEQRARQPSDEFDGGELLFAGATDWAMVSPAPAEPGAAVASWLKARIPRGPGTS